MSEKRFDEKEYWYEKYTAEEDKLNSINYELQTLQKRKHIIQNNINKYRKKYLSFVTNPLEKEEEVVDFQDEESYETNLFKKASICIKQLNKENNDLKNSISYLSDKVSSLKESNSSFERNLAQMINKYNSEKKSRIKKEKKIKSLNKEIKYLQKENIDLKKALELSEYDYRELHKEYKRTLDISLGKVSSVPSDNILMQLLEGLNE